MAGSPIVVNLTGTVANTTTAHGRPCYLTAISIVHLTSGTGFLNLYDATGTAGVTIATTAATRPTFFIPIEAGAADMYTPGGGLVFKDGLVIGSSLSASGTSTEGCTLSIGLVIE